MTWGWNVEQYAEAQVEGDVEVSVHGTSIHDTGHSFYCLNPFTPDVYMIGIICCGIEAPLFFGFLSCYLTDVNNVILLINCTGNCKKSYIFPQYFVTIVHF